MQEMILDGGTPQISLKSTLISIVPFPISEFKPGLTPGQFDVPACTGPLPVVKVIGEAVYHVYIDKDRGSLRVLDPSYKLAESIVNDYNQAQLAAKPGCHPGLFWKLGEFTVEQVVSQFAEELEAIRITQMNWFVELVKLADDDWEKTRQHYSISDVQRYALKAVDPTNSKMRPWVLSNPLLKTEAEDKTTLCPACGSDIPVSVVICRYCQYILDPVRYSKMNFGSGLSQKVDLSKVMASTRQ